jgi:glycosyltransferase involved in cell wall biosynthesis
VIISLKIAIATVQVPFIKGGAEVHASMLSDELRKKGHEVDIVTIPFKWYPPEAIIDCMMMARTVDITEVNGQKIDLVIAMKFPAYYIKHPNKVLWLLHQHRQAYELWNTEFGDLHNMSMGEEVRDLIVNCDNRFMLEAKRIFTNSATTAERLNKYNHIKATPLYHPPKNYDRFHIQEYGDFIFCPSRIDKIKRQELLVSAIKYCESPTHIVLAGSSDPRTLSEINSIIKRDNVSDRVDLIGYISDDELIDLYSRCLGVYFGPYREDYGYVTLEAFFSSKPVITHPDSGGPLEFVKENATGLIVDTNPKSIAKAIDSLYFNKNKAERLGKGGLNLLKNRNINWDFVTRSLLR